MSATNLSTRSQFTIAMFHLLHFMLSIAKVWWFTIAVITKLVQHIKRGCIIVVCCLFLLKENTTVASGQLGRIDPKIERAGRIHKAAETDNCK